MGIIFVTFTAIKIVLAVEILYHVKVECSENSRSLLSPRKWVEFFSTKKTGVTVCFLTVCLKSVIICVCEYISLHHIYCLMWWQSDLRSTTISRLTSKLLHLNLVCSLNLILKFRQAGWKTTGNILTIKYHQNYSDNCHPFAVTVKEADRF